MNNSFELTPESLVIRDKKAFFSYLRQNKLTKEKFLIETLCKKDLHTGEPLIFKNEEQYLSSYFNSRENLNEFLMALGPMQGRKFIIDWLKKRKERKKIIFAPSQIEMKSHLAPSINIIQKGLGLDYHQLVAEAELLPRFVYKSSFKTMNAGPLKIIIDSREKKPLPFLDSEVQTLSVGDYCASENYHCGVFVERKSLQDLIGTLAPKNFERFKREIHRTKELNSYLVVVVEESFSNLLRMKELKWVHSQATPDYILHKIRNLMEMNNMIQFIFVNDRNESMRIIQKIFRLGESVKELDLEYAYGLGKL